MSSLILLLLALLLPSGAIGRFNGLPWSSPAEFPVLLALAPLVVSRRLRRATIDWLAGRPALRRGLRLAAAGAIVIKLALLSTVERS